MVISPDMGKHAGVAVVAIAMGLNLLEVLPFRLPSLDVDVRTLQVPPVLQVSFASLPPVQTSALQLCYLFWARCAVLAFFGFSAWCLAPVTLSLLLWVA